MGRDKKEAVLVGLLVLCAIAQAVCVLWTAAEM